MKGGSTAFFGNAYAVGGMIAVCLLLLVFAYGQVKMNSMHLKTLKAKNSEQFENTVENIESINEGKHSVSFEMAVQNHYVMGRSSLEEANCGEISNYGAAADGI